MSAAVAWDLTPAPARAPGRPSRPRLVLVPTGDAIPAPAAAPLRITRAGRLAVTLAVAAALVALAVTLWGGGDAAAGRPAADHATTVQAGQTLSQVAVEQLPGLPIAEAVAQIVLANNLPSTQVHAGQTLVIPAVK
jgi:LysM domain-containing protein